MKFKYSENFLHDVKALPLEVQRSLKKKLDIMAEDPRHPSLRTKKVRGQIDIFEASITMDIRMTWQYTKDGIFLRNIGEHDKTLKNP